MLKAAIENNIKSSTQGSQVRTARAVCVCMALDIPAQSTLPCVLPSPRSRSETSHSARLSLADGQEVEQKEGKKRRKSVAQKNGRSTTSVRV